MSPARPKLRVVIVDDHTLFREGLRTILEMEDDLEVVADAESAEDVVELVWQTRPDVLLLDIRMPQGSGLDAVPAVLRISPRTQVLVLDPVFYPAARLDPLPSWLRGLSPRSH